MPELDVHARWAVKTLHWRNDNCGNLAGGKVVFYLKNKKNHYLIYY
jgi:hypothetical protein